MQSVHKQLLERIVIVVVKSIPFVLQLEVFDIEFFHMNSEIYSLFLLPCVTSAPIAS